MARGGRLSQARTDLARIGLARTDWQPRPAPRVRAPAQRWESRTMPDHGNAAPQDTERLVAAIRQALAGMPEIHRKAALKHATETVWTDLIDRSEHAKQAAREAGPEPGAKAAAATAAIQEAQGEPGRGSGRQ